MNLNELFELQAKLDECIYKEHPPKEGEDRLTKKILALQVELGELANEWRGFKFWSYDQEPIIEKRTYKTCPSCNSEYVDSCWMCGNSGQVVDKIINPLLEEFVDCLHFILSIGFEIGVCPEELYVEPIFCANVTEQFIDLFYEVSLLRYEERNGRLYEDYLRYDLVLEHFVGLGKLLGFTWEQIEQAYLEKVESIMKDN